MNPLLEPIYGWKLLLLGGGWILVGALLFWLTRDDKAWNRVYQNEARPPRRRSGRILAWCFSLVGFFLVVGSFTGSRNAADLAGCTWWLVVGLLTHAIISLIVKAYRSTT